MIHNCCFIIPIRTGAIVISVLGVLASAAFGVVYAKEINDGMMSTPDDQPAAKFVPYMSMSAWVLLALISLFGCIASWTAKSRLVMIYLWSLVVQWFFDSAFLGATLFFSIKMGETQRQNCLSKAHADGFTNADGLCSAAMSLSSIILLVVLGLWKLYSTYTVYAIFQFNRWAQKEQEVREAQKIMQERPRVEWVNSDTARNWSKFED